jgi:hypothetical protein
VVDHDGWRQALDPTIRLPAQASNMLEVVTPEKLWVIAGHQLLHSTDSGIHWTAIRTVAVVS